MVRIPRCSTLAVPTSSDFRAARQPLHCGFGPSHRDDGHSGIDRKEDVGELPGLLEHEVVAGIDAVEERRRDDHPVRADATAMTALANSRMTMTRS